MGWLRPSRNLVLGAAVIFLFIDRLFCADNVISKEEREELKEEARDMFYHAYRAYMENAYPADELMPLSCKGRYRGLLPSRGDMDDILGNFSLTLIDTLDTLVILGDFEEFEHAMRLIIRDVTFDTNVVVSVFETNIRILGGLLSGHILAEYLQQRAGILDWYKSELLDMAKDLGYRLLPAFNTTTGIPHGKINLRHGIKSNRLGNIRETCTACAGTMILEMAALSRLTGEPIFEEKAHRAMDELWKLRHRSSDLMGTVLNIHSGEWVRRESGVGAGIDSYYEYCLKAYILLGDERYLTRFNRHYNAVMKYVSQGPMLVDVHMHRPHTNSKNFMDALLAFWPGLQVLKGDLKPAVETHEMLYQVMQRHKFIPEAFTTDFQVHWGQHPLRPEFLESTYFLHRATDDPYYLEVGRSVLKSLQKYARVPCGYAAVSDVRTGKHEDRMDSFVLAETFKYLFLLFADENELILDLNEFLFTTEAHLLPLALASPSNYSFNAIEEVVGEEDDDDTAFSRTCPNILHLFPESVRRPLRNMVDGVCPRKNLKRRLTASEFQVSDPHHLSIAKDMGINILSLRDGRIQLHHSFSSARSISDAEEGLLFMQEMVVLSKAHVDQPEAQPQGIIFMGRDGLMLVSAGPSHFGPELRDSQRITGRIAVAQPIRACDDLENAESLQGKIAVMERGDCMFVDKARKIQEAGAIAGIVVDNTPGSSAATSPFFAMSGDGIKDVTIPVVFLFMDDAAKLILSVTTMSGIEITIGELASLKKELGHQSESTVQILKPTVDTSEPKRGRERLVKEANVGNFRGGIKDGTIEIKYRKSTEVEIITDTKEVNPVWEYQRGLLLKTIFVYPGESILLPVSTASLNYRFYSGVSADEFKEADSLTHLVWLLKEFQKHLNKHPGIITGTTIAGPVIDDSILKLITENMQKLITPEDENEVDINDDDERSDDIIVKDVKETELESDLRTADKEEDTPNDEIVTRSGHINDEL